MMRQFVLRFSPACRRSIYPSTSIRNQSTAYTSSSDGLAVEVKDQVLWIKFNRPQKYNAILAQMYLDMTKIFTAVNKDDSIKALVLTGNGDYYSSGNDLTNFTFAMKDPEGPKEGLTKTKEVLIDFVDSFICLEKFIIAAVNGPAVGIPVTTLPLCDYVIASDKASFQTPFTALGQCPEACSSLTFPAIFGRAKASELLLLNMTWSAPKALENGLVAEVVEHANFHERLDKLTKTILKTCYPGAMKVSKSLISGAEFKQKLLEANRRECDAILKCWCGPECMDAVQKFLQRSKA